MSSGFRTAPSSLKGGFFQGRQLWLGRGCSLGLLLCPFPSMSSEQVASELRPAEELNIRGDGKMHFHEVGTRCAEAP